jgi:hypothetical protein
MKLRLVNAAAAMATYVLAYAVAFPIFRLSLLARRLLRRGQRGQTRSGRRCDSRAADDRASRTAATRARY